MRVEGMRNGLRNVSGIEFDLYAAQCVDPRRAPRPAGAGGTDLRLSAAGLFLAKGLRLLSAALIMSACAAWRRVGAPAFKPGIRLK